MSRFIRASRYRHLVLAATAAAFFLVAPGVLPPYALITLCYALVFAIAGAQLVDLVASRSDRSDRAGLPRWSRLPWKTLIAYKARTDREPQ